MIAAHGITDAEYKKIVQILGRDPNFTELGIFSVMWSEHCSYKNSKPVLKTFPTEGPNLLVRAGEENAGIVDIGDGLAVCFKIESHNHPSAIEPFQGNFARYFHDGCAPCSPDELSAVRKSGYA